MKAPSPIDEIVGRTAERAAIDRLLERLAIAPGALVLEGAAGMGKTTLWRHAVRRAEARGTRVLWCRPVEAETRLTFAALADLLEPVASVALPALPAPQRLALEVALLRAASAGSPPGARAVATAVLSALRMLAADAPVLIAIDDQQWLDRASAEALAFVFRRLADARVGVVAAVRVAEDVAADPCGLATAFGPGLVRVRLGPLGSDDLHHVLRDRLERAVARPTLRRIVADSGGNPFFALEIARALVDAGVQPAAGEPFPVPAELGGLLRARLARLPGRTRSALLVAAATSEPTIVLVERVLGGDAQAALARAVEAGVVELRGHAIRFTHPLLASALYGATSAGARRDLHGRIAAAASDLETRARHLALAADGADESVARALDEAATAAWRRGAPDEAGVLAETAARLSVDAEGRAARGRALVAAEHFVQAGDRARARPLLERVLATDAAGDERAAALRILGRIRGEERSFAEAIVCLEAALAHAVDAPMRIGIALDLAYAAFNGGELRRAVTVARSALADAERLGDPGLLGDALCLVAAGRLVGGRAGDRSDLERALALEDRTRPGQLELRPTALAGIMAAWEGRLVDAHAQLEEICGWAVERGEESGLPFLLCNLSWVDWWRGELGAALDWAERARVVAEQSGAETMRGVAFMQRGRARAGRGDVDGARADFAAARRLLEEGGFVQGMPWLLSGEAWLALALDDAASAARVAAPLVALADAGGMGGLFLDFAPDALEALTQTGDLETAASLLARFANRAEILGRPWARAAAARGRSVLAAAHGDVDTALAAALAATEAFAPLAMPVDLGRALLALGCVRRRRGERRLAREALDRARDVFVSVGAVLWAERATTELGRVPIRRGRSADLTPTEERVAALAAEGRTNAQVAHTLFMSPKTVEANLTRIYGKLGIRSRAELGARMQARSAGRRTKE